LNYYIYYEVDPGRAAALRAAVARLMATLEAQCGVRGRWMRRRDDPSTYMEVYEGVEDTEAFERLLERESASLAREFSLERRLERFVCA
jgi:hypothetical protein